MQYSSVTVTNKSKLKKFSHQKRFKVATKLLKLDNNDDFLDFGTGDGYLLNTLTITYPNSKVSGYEPIESMYNQLKLNIISPEINLINDLDTIKDKKYTKIGCFEVLEHFNEENQRHHLKVMKSILKEDGVIVISVPIEIGISSLFKNIARLLLKQKHGLTTRKNIWKAFLGRKIERLPTYYINSHIGFNYKELEKTFLKEDLEVIKKTYSPLKYLYSLFNSQVFYILKHKA
jgi:cyclopropane fatty-acyl-phospholipid synthase-like methyltransferase